MLYIFTPVRLGVPSVSSCFSDVDVFKVHLDKFWAQQEVMFDWTADLTGTGDRSEYTVESN